MLARVDADDGGVAEVDGVVEVDALDDQEAIRSLEALVESLTNDLAERTEALRRLEERKAAFERAIEWAAQLEAERGTDDGGQARAELQALAQRLEDSERALAEERVARAADAAAHARALAAERALRDEELAELAGVAEEADKSIRAKHTSDLASRARAHAADLA